MRPEDIAYARDNFNRLPNLQLLSDATNESKKDKPLLKWLEAENNPDYYRATNLIPDVDLSLSNFREFYDVRKQMLLSELKKKLGVVGSQTEAEESASVDELVTGEDDASE